MNKILSEKITDISSILKKHKVLRAYVFGSVCTEKFNAKSDIDFIISFDKPYFNDYAENYFSLETDLKKLFNRPVDLITENSLRNPFLIKEIEKTKSLIYG